jgi:hypothetical protein
MKPEKLVQAIENGEYNTELEAFVFQGGCDWCGSQRCDSSPLWASGCSKFIEFILRNYKDVNGENNN